MTVSSSPPIVFLSVFKSGTHLMRKILTDMTSLDFIEPTIIPGKVDYTDANQLFSQKGYYYSWHLIPTPQVQSKLKDMAAIPIFLLRNVFDMTVSMYYHFARNIDADIGRGRNVDHYFKDMSKSEGLTAIINGLQKPDFNWKGLGPHLEQMELMLTFAQEYPCFVTTFENITSHKFIEIKRLAQFLNLPLSDQQLCDIEQASSFNQMRAAARQKNKGSHYRKGKKNSHIDELTHAHIRLIQQAVVTHSPNLPKLSSIAGIDDILCTPLVR